MAFRIAILGIGGVGGYFGGKLAAHYRDSRDVEVIFIARGAHLEAIRKNGLKLITPQNGQVIHPAVATGDPSTLGRVDLVLVCVKNYDLEASLEALRPCVDEKTILISLLNGVDGPARMRTLFPQAQVWEGFAYIISLLGGPGIVRETGNIHQLYFGSVNASPAQLDHVKQLLVSAGIEACAPADIFAAMWEKFHFISAIGTLTSSLDLPIGKILETEHRETLLQLLLELKAVADAKGIRLQQNAVDLTLEKMKMLPYETTSSMHRDFSRGKRTELESLTGYVVREGRAHNIPAPVYEEHYARLKKKLED